MAKYRKRPVVIEAVQYDGSNMPDGVCDGGLGCKSVGAPDGSVPHVHTLEGDMTVSVGDWIITGVKGERYPCKPDIFAATYERVMRPARDEKVKAEAVKEYRARILQIAAKALKHRKKAETDGAARIAYDFCANEYLDTLLAEILPPGRLPPLIET